VEKNFFFARLKERGYTAQNFLPIAETVDYSLRDQYLNASKARNKASDRILPFIIRFDSHLERNRITNHVKQVLSELNIDDEEVEPEAVDFVRNHRVITAFQKHKTLFGHLVSSTFDT
jgi:hypothetical protein